MHNHILDIFASDDLTEYADMKELTEAASMFAAYHLTATSPITMEDESEIIESVATEEEIQLQEYQVITLSFSSSILLTLL